MKLHEDKFAFLNIINLIHEASSIRADILEKDYYVTLLLRELAGKQVTLPAYFKGGTALYKAQKSIRRFSEDIDLTVCIDNCSNSQAKKRLDASNINGHILFGMTGRDVVTTVANGRVLMKDREIKVIDVEEAMAKCREESAKLWHSING